MSSPTPSRRPLQRLGLAGIGSAVLLVGIASPAAAADPVSVALDPPVVGVSAFPIENFGGVLDPMADPANATFAPVAVEYGDTLTVQLPAEVVGSGTEVSLGFDNDMDGTVEKRYSSAAGATDPLLVSGLGTGTLTITLPTDDGVNGPSAYLSVDPGPLGFGPAYNVDPTEYLLEIDSTALDPVTLTPPLLVEGYLPCASPAACTVAAGSPLSLTLPSSSALREIGITDLSGLLVGLQPLDADGAPTGAAPVPLTYQLSADDQSATVGVPAGTAVGSYGLLVARPLTSGASVLFNFEFTVVAPEAAAPPAAAPTTPAAAPAVVNAGLRSNTGVEAVETGSTGTVAIAVGAGMLALAGGGGVAVARTRRRPAAEGGTCA